MLRPLMLEIATAIFAILLLVVAAVSPKDRGKVSGYLTLASILVLFVVNYLYQFGIKGTYFFGTYRIDEYSYYFKQILLISVFWVTLMSFDYTERFFGNRGEYFALLMFSLLGAMVMASAVDLITFYVGLELMTISFIIMTAFETHELKSSESGMKYVLLSAMSSAVLLYGLSLIYGITGSTTYSDIIGYLSRGTVTTLIIFAVIATISGFGFKIAAVPFHMWSPDIYEGAPTPVTAFLAIGSKVAAFAALGRVLFEALASHYSVFIGTIITLSILSMVIGNLIAIPQENIKRLLAYSSIAHAGYVLIGLIAYTTLGISAVLYYLLVYIFANTAAFASVVTLSKNIGSDNIKDYSGMWKRSPFVTAAFIISLVSLAGIPPAAGFVGKFYLFTAVIRQGYTWLAFIAIAMSTVSVYYYMVIARVMFLGDTDNNTKISVSLPSKIVLALTTIATIIIGIYPGPIIDFTGYVASGFFR